MIDGRERTSGKDGRGKRDGSGRDGRGMRGVCLRGLRGKEDAKDEKGRTDGRGKSEKIGVKDRMRGGEGRIRFEDRNLGEKPSN